MTHSATQTISRIDQEIDAVRKELRSREKGIKPLSAASWQAAWDRHPDLHDREVSLFHQRGTAQRERDEAAFKALSSRASRSKPAKKCPTCGCRTLAAA